MPQAVKLKTTAASGERSLEILRGGHHIYVAGLDAISFSLVSGHPGIVGDFDMLLFSIICLLMNLRFPRRFPTLHGCVNCLIEPVGRLILRNQLNRAGSCHGFLGLRARIH